MSLENYHEKMKTGTIEEKLDLINERLSKHIDFEDGFHKIDREYQERFDRHLEIYANNGKELKNLSDLFERRGEVLAEHGRMLQEISVKLAPISETFTGMGFLERTLLKLGAVVGAITALIFGWHEIFKK